LRNYKASLTISTVHILAPPLAPADVTGTRIGPTGVQLRWSPVAAAEL